MNIKKILVLTACSTMLAACSKNSPTGTNDTTATKKPANTDTAAIPQYGTPVYDTNIFYVVPQEGTITDAVMSGASGMGASHFYSSMLWIENDQGGQNDIYLVDTTGAKRAVFAVTGATNRDWTDIAMGPGPDTLTTYIYMADIGDSKGNHNYSIIYRFPEPQVPLGSTVLNGTTASADQIRYVYPSSDGPHDAETILLDPQSKDIYIVDKNTASDVYYLPYPQSTDTIITAQKIIAYMPVPNGPLRSGGIAPDRSGIVMKSYTEVLYWAISPGESILNALLATPVQTQIAPENQGEALCFTTNNDGFWTTSKFATNNYAPLDRYIRK